jgi:hypothetical protein
MPQAAAIRMRRYRQRQATGCLSVTTDFSPEETAKLCRLRYLTECELEDRERIADALHVLLYSPVHRENPMRRTSQRNLPPRNTNK